MINPATSWFEMLNCQYSSFLISDASTPTGKKGKKGKKTNDKDPYFDKSSAMTANWYIRPGLVDIHVVEMSSMITVVNSSFVSSPYAARLDSSVSQPVSRIHKQTQNCSAFIKL